MITIQALSPEFCRCALPAPWVRNRGRADIWGCGFLRWPFLSVLLIFRTDWVIWGVWSPIHQSIQLENRIEQGRLPILVQLLIGCWLGDYMPFNANIDPAFVFCAPLSETQNYKLIKLISWNIRPGHRIASRIDEANSRIYWKRHYVSGRVVAWSLWRGRKLRILTSLCVSCVRLLNLRWLR